MSGDAARARCQTPAIDGSRVGGVMGLEQWLAAAALSKKQFGVISLAQLRNDLQVTRSSIRTAVARGRIERLFDSAYRFPGAEDDWRQNALAATLIAGSGSALSHSTAGALYHLPGLEPRATSIHLSVPSRKSVLLPARFVLHRPRHPFLRVVRDGLPMTSVPRTIIDLAGMLDPRALEAVLDDAHHRFPGLERQLQTVLTRIGSGFGGVRALRALLAERRGQATESPLELEVWRALRRARFPRPRLQLELRVGDEYVMKVDFAWPMHRIALHVDGYRWHARRQTFDTDARQRTRLAALGWVNLTVTSRSLEHGGWLDDLANLLRERTPQGQLRL